MPQFKLEWFDIVSIFSRESTPGTISVHAFKRPHTCIQFFIPAEVLESDTCWEDIYNIAVIKWAEGKKNKPPVGKPCQKCGRYNWQRFYEGHTFCGFCGLNYPPVKKFIVEKEKHPSYC